MLKILWSWETHQLWCHTTLISNVRYTCECELEIWSPSLKWVWIDEYHINTKYIIYHTLCLTKSLNESLGHTHTDHYRLPSVSPECVPRPPDTNYILPSVSTECVYLDRLTLITYSHLFQPSWKYTQTAGRWVEGQEGQLALAHVSITLQQEVFEIKQNTFSYNNQTVSQFFHRTKQWRSVTESCF